MAAPELRRGLSFTDFLAKMKAPAAADLVRNIKSFIRQFEERSPGQAVDPEADSAQVQAFLSQSELQFQQHPVWRGCQPEVLDQAVEGLEKYVMSKVWRQTFAVWQEDRERDERYQRLMQALGFVELPALMGSEVHPDSSLLEQAQGELLKMDRYKAPRDKLLCLVNVKTMVENIVQLAARAGANIGGADAFFPVFLFVAIRSRLPHLAANVEYIRRFRSRPRLTGQFDFMLCQLESVSMFLDTVNYEHLGVDQHTFLAYLAAAGIPEAHLELARMQQQQQQQAPADADLGADYGNGGRNGNGNGNGNGGGGSTGLLAQPPPPGGGEGAAAAAPGADDVLAGLQLSEECWLRPSSEARSTSSATHAAGGAGSGASGAGLAAAPAALGTGAAAAAAGCHGQVGKGEQGSPLPAGGLAAPSPTVLEPGSCGARMGGGGGEVQQELSFEEEEEEKGALQQDSDTAAWQGQQQQEQEHRPLQQQRQQQQREQQGQQQQYAEPALIEEMVGEGARHVLAAEASGQLQGRYPYMYAAAEDLALADVQAVLLGYKELLLRYEALSRSLQRQLGLEGGDGSTAAAGSGGLGRGGEASAALLPVVHGQAGSADCSPPGPRDVSPAAKWSPGGILQRIASTRGPGRTSTPPRRRSDEGGAVGSAQEEGQGRGAGRVAPLFRLSPSKQGAGQQRAFFPALFGSGASGGSGSPQSPAGLSPPQASQAQQASSPAPQQQPHAAPVPVPAGRDGGGRGTSQPDVPSAGLVQQQQAAAQGDAGRSEPSFADEFAGSPLAAQSSGLVAAAAAAGDRVTDLELTAPAADSPTETAPAASKADVGDASLPTAAEGGAGQASCTDAEHSNEQERQQLAKELDAAPSGDESAAAKGLVDGESLI